MYFTEPRLPLTLKYSDVPVYTETKRTYDRTVISHKDTYQPLAMFLTPKVSNSLRQPKKTNFLLPQGEPETGMLKREFP